MANPDIDIWKADLHSRRAELAAPAAAAHGAPDRHAVAVYQRLLRLVPRSDGERSPTPAEDATVQALHGAGFGSAHDVAALSEPRFVERAGPALSGGAEAARDVHRRAVATVHAVQQLALSVRLAVGSPHARAQPSHHAARALTAYFEAIPSYPEMFGSLDYCTCAACQSIFGPAAYLVDLLRLVDTYIVESNEIPHDWRLDVRRPDLYTTPLDCAATDDIVPYLALVVAILAEQIATRTGKDAFQVAAAAPYPFNLPFALPLVQIREYLARMQTSLAAVFASFVVPAPGQSPVTTLSVARERLAISLEQLAIVTTPRTTEASLAPYYGYAGTLPITDLSRVALFLERTGLTRDRLVDLLTQGLSAQELAAGVADALFINATGEGLPAMTLRYEDVAGEPVETIANLSLLRLDRVNRFVRLSAHTALSFADLDWALVTAPDAPISAGTVD
ncbi:MAG TPA: Tc toxin subunit A, partial [Kofleriaceae bacterium]|nr:Tc toxin subunit A [Kofleriaceae bacterium]